MYVKWTKAELNQYSGSDFEFEEDLKFNSTDFDSNNRLTNLLNVHIFGKCCYDSHSKRFEIHLVITGDMIIPCAITLESLTTPFDIESCEIFSFEQSDDENIHYCKKDWIDLNPVVFQLILSEVPVKMVKSDIQYPKGDGWEIMTEKDYLKSKADEIDPRLAKLKEFKFDKN